MEVYFLVSSFIVSELVSSEKDYVARLEFCVQVSTHTTLVIHRFHT